MQRWNMGTLMISTALQHASRVSTSDGLRPRVTPRSLRTTLCFPAAFTTHLILEPGSTPESSSTGSKNSVLIRPTTPRTRCSLEISEQTEI